MSAASRKLDVGARVVTDFSGRLTIHIIIERIVGQRCQSGIMYRVEPTVPGSTGAGVDADWFEPWT